MSRLQRDPDNRRRAVRHSTFVKAQIRYGPRHSVTIPCTIQNISTGGAMIETTEVSLLPLDFRLLDPSQGLAWDAKVVWRRGNQVGVSFLRTIDQTSKAGLGARAVRAVKSLVKR